MTSTDPALPGLPGIPAGRSPSDGTDAPAGHRDPHRDGPAGTRAALPRQRDRRTPA
ncbi:hypothetical protein EDC03_0519 [Pseudokineococcus lusitanus]|uniref:Uncharacterized protein n=1 Tax=Pseudokineococcus lusitanus TaxID=763993 RepID=A0A3N1HTW5_9ACTN|nr:hypothetical protein EDC03_0519 [Pseudokineococcus lusitanus]